MRRAVSALEDEVMRIVWKRGTATAAEVLDELSRPLSNASVRTILRRLEHKGYLRHKEEGRAFVYMPRVAQDDVAIGAVRTLVQRFFGGSATSLVMRLLDDGLVDKREVARLSRRVKRLKRDRA